MRARPLPLPRRAAGFTMIEALVALGVTVLLLVAILTLFDLNNRIARVQIQVTEMQQSLRVAQSDMVRLVRMTGRGGLPAGVLPQGRALAVRNDAGDGGASLDIALGYPLSPQVWPATDVLTLRGVFASPVYQINHTDNASFDCVGAAGACTCTLRVDRKSHTGITQKLELLKKAVDDDVREALILASPLDDAIYAVAELDPAASDVSDDDSFSLEVRLTGGVNTAAYNALSAATAPPCDPAGKLKQVAFAGILEEYRYYLRHETGVTPNPGSPARLRLSRAQLFPGTEVAYANRLENLSVDVADNIVDLQVAIGLDADGDGVITDAAADDDEWLFNHAEDDPGDPNWANARLSYIRLNALATTDRADWQYRAPPLVTIEDRNYSEPVTPADEATRQARMFRRRLLQTIIDLRNIA